MKTTTIIENMNLPYSAREAFRTLRTNFLFCGSNIKTVLITSCAQGEGKTTVSFELAKLLSISEKKVLFLDADLRRSDVVSRYTENTTNVKGLSEYLSDQASFDDVMYSTQYENLNLIFAGSTPPNPVELLGSNKFKELILSSRENYDYVIIDTAPLGAVIDASVVSNVCDGAAIVVTANKTSYRFASQVKEQLEKSNCKIIGTIINRVPTKSKSSYNKYYKNYYSKY